MSAWIAQGCSQLAAHKEHTVWAASSRRKSSRAVGEGRLRRCPPGTLITALLLLPARSLSPLATSTTLKRLCCLSLFIHISFVCPSSFPCCSVPHFGTLSPLASLFLYWFACPLLCPAQPALSCACLSILSIFFLPFRPFRLRLPYSPDLLVTRVS